MELRLVIILLLIVDIVHHHHHHRHYCGGGGSGGGFAIPWVRIGFVVPVVDGFVLSTTPVPPPVTANNSRRPCGGVSCYARPKTKWDLIEDELESSSFDNEVGAGDKKREGSNDDDYDDDDDDDQIYAQYTQAAPDMSYEPRNLKRQHETFVDIRQVGGKDVTNDVYVRVPSQDVFWYSGKVAKVSDVTLEECVGRQWAMIERHACNLRPIELYPHRGTLEIWTAPGDSELDVAYNRPSVQMVKMTKPTEIITNRQVSNNKIGFQGEVYHDGEQGFRTWRTDDGLPARPEINPGGETRPPTDEEYAKIQQELAGKDINALYEEQQKRLKKKNE